MLPFEHLQKSNTKENLWIYILCLLKKREIYGWEIPALIQKNFSFLPGKITPYRVLYRLEKDSFVKSKLKRRRRVYEITKKGKQELNQAKSFFQKLSNKIK